MKKYLHILKLRIRWWLNNGWTFKISIGRELTSNERGELARWITRNVTESCAETLHKVRIGAPIEGFDADEDFG